MMVRRLSALVWLRWRLWWNGLRSRSTAGDTAVGIILAALGAILSLALAVGLAAITSIGLRDGTLDSVSVALTVVCWTVGLLAVVMPVFFGLGQPQVPLRRLAVFPFSRWQLYRIQLAASFAGGVHVFWYPILVAVVAVGVTFNGAPAIQWSVLATVFGVCLVVWCNTVLALVQHALRGRRARELVVLFALVLVVVFSLVPALFERQLEERGEEWIGDLVPSIVTSAIVRTARVFPPSIAAKSLGSTFMGESGGTVGALLLMVLWTAAGIVMGSAVVLRNLGNVRASGDGSVATARSVRPSKVLSMDRFGSLPVEIRAVAAKELHYLFRSTPGKFNVVIMPIFVTVMAVVVARDLDRSFLGLDRVSLVFVGLMIYAAMFSNNFLFNAYAWEGAGVQSYFLCPVSPQRIVVGKNLGVWLYNAVLGVEGVVAFSAVSGVPPLSALFGGCFAFTAAVLAATMMGNFLSPAFPVPRDIGSITNSPSQIAVVATIGLLIASAVVVGGLMTVPALLGLRWLGPLLLLLLTAVEIILYMAVSKSAGRTLQRYREPLIQALQAVPG